MLLFQSQQQKVINQEGVYHVYRRRRLGSCYPSLSKEENKELSKLFPSIKRKTKKVVKNMEPPDIYYKAHNELYKRGW